MRNNMNFANCRRLVSLLMFCGVAVLVIVNGQSTTDDGFDKDESSRLTVEAFRADLKAELRAEMRAEFRVELRAELRAERAKSADAINSLKNQIAKLENNDTGKNVYIISLHNI